LFVVPALQVSQRCFGASQGDLAEPDSLDQVLSLDLEFYPVILWIPVTTAVGNMFVTLRRASEEDSAKTVILRPEPRIE
jgi:hypothetical protein